MAAVFPRNSQETEVLRPFGRRSPILGVSLVLLALSLPLVVYRIGDPGMMDPDEPYYAVPALEMLRSGTWQVPVFRGEPWFDKPILFYWMVLGAYHAFGVTEGAARAGSAAAGIATALAVLLLARRGSGGVRTAAIGAIVLSTSLLHVVVSRAAITDMTFTLFVTLAFLAFAAFFRTGSIPAALAGGASTGLAVLTKGPAGALLLLVGVGAYTIFARRFDLVRPKALAASVAGALATAGPWYGWMLVAHRDLVVRSFLEQGNLGRFLEPEHASFPFYYTVVILAGLLPWSGALPFALLSSIRRAGSPPDGLYLLCWIGSVLAVFSLAASKLPSYVLPAWPALALLVAAFWAEPAPEKRRSRALALSAVLAAAAVCGLLVVGRKPDYREAAFPLAAAGCALLAGALLAFPAYRRRGVRGIAASYAAAMVAAVLILVTLAVPRLEPWQSTRTLVRQLETDGLAGEVVGAYRVPDVSLELYLGRAPRRAPTLPSLRVALAEIPEGIWVVPTRRLESLRADPALRVEDVRLGPRRSAVRIRTR